MPMIWIAAAGVLAAAAPAAAPAPEQPALAAAPATPPAQTPAKAGTSVSAVVVAAGPAPKVVVSFPADHAEIPGGILIVKVVFDQPMAADAWSYGRAEDKAFPACLDRPRLLADLRTSVLLCSAAANTDYAMAINPVPRFASANGRSAAPIVLHFRTAGVGVRTLHDALDQAGLSDADDPIMRWRDSGAGVSDSPGPAAPQ